MNPNLDKLAFGRFIESQGGTPTSDGCHNYGIVNGCDEGCPVLLEGRCQQPAEAMGNCEFDDDDRKDLERVYGLTPESI